MAESQKGASSMDDSKKKSPLLEHHNEHDFLDSWKSTPGGKDVLDFSDGAAPRERKKVFDFGKLDDFELDAEFGKISSFKMDMSDLDFSSPQKKTEKSKERPGKEVTSGKLEGKKDHFSFSFDFNELDTFDLDTNLLKGEKKPKKCAEGDVLDIFENDVRDLEKLGRRNGSNSKDLVSSKVDLDTTKNSIAAPANPEQCDMPYSKAPTLQENQIANTQGGKEKTSHSEDKRDFQGEHPLTTGPKKLNDENFVQDFSVQSNDYSGTEILQQFQTAGPSSATVGANSGEEKGNASVRSEDYSRPRTNSLAKEDAKYLAAVCTEESMNTDNEPEKNESNEKNADQGSAIFEESPKMQKDIVDDSAGSVLNKTLPGRRSNEEKLRSDSKVLGSSLHRNSKSEQLALMKENGSCGLPLLPVNKSEAPRSRLSSATTPKQLYAICKKKMETMNLHPANEKSEQSVDRQQGGNHNGGVLKSLNRTLKGGRIAVESDTNQRDSNTSFDIRRPISSTEITNLAASVENHGISLPNADKKHDLSNMNVPRIAKSNKYLLNTLMKGTLAGHSKENMVEHSKTSPIAVHSVGMKKSAILSPPLKRKSIEGSHMDLSTLNSSKRIVEDRGERRNPLQISPRIHGQVVPGSEGIGSLYSDVYLDHQDSLLDVHVDGGPMDLEVPLSIESDGNIEKAEACTKELENICNMLKRKNEEAKELLVRAIINNNALLMLDHPMYEEKIIALQRFAASMALKKYDT